MSAKKSKISLINIVSMLAFICFLAEAYLVLNKFGAEGLAGILGETTVYSIFAVFLLRRLLKGSSLAIFIPLTLCFTGVVFYKVHESAELDSTIRRDGHKLVTAFKDLSKKDLKEGEFLSDKQISDLGIFSDVVRNVKNSAGKMQEIFLRYSEFFESKLGKPLSAEVSNKKVRETYKKNILMIQEKLILSKKQIEDVLHDFETGLNLDKIPVAVRSSFLSGFRQSMKENRDYMDRFFELNSKFLQGILDFYLFLDNSEGKFELVDNQIEFNNEVDLDIANGFIKDIQENAKLQEALGEKYEKEVQMRLEKWKEIEEKGGEYE